MTKLLRSQISGSFGSHAGNQYLIELRSQQCAIDDHVVRCQVDQRAKALEERGNHCRSIVDIDKEDKSAVTEQQYTHKVGVVALPSVVAEKYSQLSITLWFSIDGCLIFACTGTAEVKLADPVVLLPYLRTMLTATLQLHPLSSMPYLPYLPYSFSNPLGPRQLDPLF